ncbi:UNVERIFIED_CONTAM: hypothetical protein K2H54_042694 [Gekko kuhli]
MDPIIALLIVSCQIFQLQASFQAPQLTVTPRSPYYVTGQAVTLTCSQSGYGKTKIFIFFKDETELNSSEWSREHSKSYHISQLQISSSGAYSCQYCTASSMGPIHCLESNSVWITVLEDGNYSCKFWVVDSEWEIPSQESNIIIISVTVLAQFPKISLEYAALAIPLLVLLVLLVVYCMRKKKASEHQQQFELTASKEERDLDSLGSLPPQAAALQQQEGSEVTYADVRISSAGTPLKPMMRNKLKPVEEEMVLYSRVRFQPTCRATK